MPRILAAGPVTDWLPGFDPEAAEPNPATGWVDLFIPGSQEACERRLERVGIRPG